MELEEAARADILYYPGSGGNIFDPMLGGFYPTLGYPVVWTLSGAPSGVTIDKQGLITVSGVAQLSDMNSITVKAAYHGKTYEAILGITKARGGAPGRLGDRGKDGDAAIFPKYRGVTTSVGTNAGKATVAGVQITMDNLDWVLFMGTTGWEKYFLYQWHEQEQAWEKLDRGRNISKYSDILNDITDGAPDGIFSELFCQVLFAQQAAIDTLASKVLRMSGNGEIVSANYDDGSQSEHNRVGFRMIANDGSAVFNKIDTFEMRGYSKFGPSAGGVTDYYPNITGRVYGYIRGGCSGVLTASGTITNLRKTDNIDAINHAGYGGAIIKIKLKDDGWTDVNIYTKMRVFGYAIGATSIGSTLCDNYLFIPFFNGYDGSTKEMFVKFVKGHQAGSYTIDQGLYFDITLYC
jgi:hypothetical protein